MTFVPENPLEEALVRGATEPAARPEFYRLLLASQLFVIGEIGSPGVAEGPASLDTGDRLMIATVTYEGRDYHPVFSALSRLQAFVRQESRYLAVPGRGLFENTMGANFLLNPGSEFGKELLAGEIAHLLNASAGQRTVTYEKATQVQVGEPAAYPQALVDALKAMFEARPDVLAAHLVQVAFQEEDEAPHPLIGVEIAGDWPAVSQEIGKVLKAVNPGFVVDAVEIDREKPSELTRALLKVPPFYMAGRAE